MIVDVVIPAFNEENSIDKVIADIPKNWVREIVVINNNSTDSTRKKALEQGATVLDEPLQGYGASCLNGINYVRNKIPQPDILVFIDADYSDYPNELPKLIAPIQNEGYDMVIGSRALGKRENGAMLPQQIFGNWLATFLMRILGDIHYTDLGPFRAIRFSKLLQINMSDLTYGWTIEMQLKAVKYGLKTCEVPVSYRKRIGFSKITGTLKGTFGAGFKIITTIFKYL